MTIYSLAEGSLDEYKGKYSLEIGPMFSRAHEDPDLEVIKRWDKT